MKNKTLHSLLSSRKIDLDLQKIKKKDSDISSIFYDSSRKIMKLKYNNPMIMESSNVNSEQYESRDIINYENSISFNQLQKSFKNFDLIDFKTQYENQTLVVNVPYGLYGFINGNYSMAKPISYAIQNENIVEGYRVYGRTIDVYTQYFNNDNTPYQRYVIGIPVSKYKINNAMKRKCNFTMDMTGSYASFSWDYKTINDLSTNYYDNETESKFIMFNKPDRYKLMNFDMIKLQEFTNYVRYYDGVSVRYGDYKEMILNSDGDTICTYYIYNPSNIYTGMDATKYNTYTNRYILTYNKTKKKVLNTQYDTKLPYCRVLENGNLVNYYRKPIGSDGRYVEFRIQQWYTPDQSNEFIWGNNYWWKEINRKVGDNSYSTYTWCVDEREYAKGWWWEEFDAYYAMGWINTNKYNDIVSCYQECFENDDDRSVGSSYGYSDFRKYTYDNVNRDVNTWVRITDFYD